MFCEVRFFAAFKFSLVHGLRFLSFLFVKRFWFLGRGVIVIDISVCTRIWAYFCLDGVLLVF